MQNAQCCQVNRLGSDGPACLSAAIKAKHAQMLKCACRWEKLLGKVYIMMPDAFPVIRFSNFGFAFFMMLDGQINMRIYSFPLLRLLSLK